MKTTTKIIAATLAVVSLSAVSIVSAHQGGGAGLGYGCGAGQATGMMGHGMGPGAGMGPGHTMGGMRGMGGMASPAVTAARLGDMKAALKITPAQETAWASYEAQVKQQAQTRQTFHTAMQAQMQDPKLSIDRNAQHETMSKLFAAQAEARTALVAVLTPEQKALFEQPQGAGYGRGHGRHMAWQATAPTK